MGAIRRAMNSSGIKRTSEASRPWGAPTKAWILRCARYGYAFPPAYSWATASHKPASAIARKSSQVSAVP